VFRGGTPTTFLFLLSNAPQIPGQPFPVSGSPLKERHGNRKVGLFSGTESDTENDPEKLQAFASENEA
jgi:hypothetical protein